MNKKMPIGHFSKKHHKMFIFMLVSCILLEIGLIYLFEDVLNIEAIVSIFISFVIAVIYVYFISILTNPVSQAILKFNRDINFSEYERTILKLLEEESLHDESKIYLKLIYVNYLYLYDLDTATSYFDSIEKPNFKNYNYQYKLISLLNSMNKKDFDEASRKLMLFKKQYPKNRNIKSLETYLTVFSTNEEIDKVKEIFSISKSSNAQRLINAQVLMHYFQTRNNIEEAKVYAKYVLEHANDLKGTMAKAQEIINLE
jgi:hypothetical protein